MNKKTGIFFAASVGFILFCSTSYAEKIYLLDGGVISGKIIERNEIYVVSQSGAILKKYYMAQIDRIEEDRPEDSVEDIGIDFNQFKSLGMPEQKAKLIVAMIKASGVYQALENNMSQALASIPEDQRASYQALFNVQEVVARLVPVYDKFYTDEDLRGVIAFYQSPLGQKVLKVTPEIMKESVSVSLQYLKEKIPAPAQPSSQ